MQDTLTSEPENTGPLKGIKVLELGTLIAGPFASRLLAEFGADVVKVEAPDGGDPIRKWRVLHEGNSLWWAVQARNKKSLTLNLKSPEGLDVLKQLLSQADILVENFFGPEPPKTAKSPDPPLGDHLFWAYRGLRGT